MTNKQKIQNATGKQAQALKAIKKGVSVQLPTDDEKRIGKVTSVLRNGNVVKVQWPGKDRETTHDPLGLILVEEIDYAAQEAAEAEKAPEAKPDPKKRTRKPKAAKKAEPAPAPEQAEPPYEPTAEELKQAYTEAGIGPDSMPLPEADPKTLDLSQEPESFLEALEKENPLTAVPATEPAPAPEPAKTEEPTSLKPRHGKIREGFELFGQSASSVLRWMGVQGFTLKQAQQALAAQAITVKRNAAATYLYAGKAGKRGAPAVLTTEQADSLRLAAGLAEVS